MNVVSTLEVIDGVENVLLRAFLSGPALLDGVGAVGTSDSSVEEVLSRIRAKMRGHHLDPGIDKEEEVQELPYKH